MHLLQQKNRPFNTMKKQINFNTEKQADALAAMTKKQSLFSTEKW